MAMGVECLDVIVPHSHAPLAAAGADALGEDGAVYANVVESRHVQSEKERSVCSRPHPLAVTKVVFPRCGIVHHLYLLSSQPNGCALNGSLASG